jgi:hypothetical protein
VRNSTVRILGAGLAGTLLMGPSAGAEGEKAYKLYTRLTAAIEKCWISSRDAAFADYVYSPEPNATNGPRILIVPRKNPVAVPLLVIEITRTGGHVSVYGPMATGADAGRIGEDLKRWIGGGDGCG